MLPWRVLRYDDVERLVKGLSGLCVGVVGSVVVVVVVVDVLVVVVVVVDVEVGTVLAGGPLAEPALVAKKTKPANNVTGTTLRNRSATSPPAPMVRANSWVEADGTRC
jgi:hypothetical protein